MEQLKNTLSKCNQHHLLEFYHQLNDLEKRELINQLDEINFEEVNVLFRDALRILNESRKHGPVEPVPVSQFGSQFTCGDDKLNEYKENGLEAISEGHVAVLVLAGGQGTRLGNSDPKGMFSVGLPSGKTLFQLQVERILRLQALAEIQTGRVSTIPWYIMTSEATHQQLLEYLQINNYFGLNGKNVVLFKQGLLPCFTFDGKIFLETKSSVAMAPDGNGGLFRALEKNGVFDDMEDRGVKYVHVHSVDNILVKVADPIFTGYFIESDADCAAKVIKKIEPKENLAVICKINGRYDVIEYNEISDEDAYRRDENGELVFSAGSMCIHLFTAKFMKKMAKTDLKVHVAKKKIPFVDQDGNTVQPGDVNGIKIENFIFDSFAFTDKFVTWEVCRAAEFSALKNPDHMRKDCAFTARRDLLQLHKTYVEVAHGKVYGEVEISPLVSYAGEGLLERVKGITFGKSMTVHIQSDAEFAANKESHS